jgi:hypothetical protein
MHHTTCAHHTTCTHPARARTQPQGLSVELKGAGVTVFGNPSKKDSLVLVLPDVRGSVAADAGAPLLRAMLNGRVYVKWPYLQEAEVGGFGARVLRMRMRVCVCAGRLCCGFAALEVTAELRSAQPDVRTPVHMSGHMASLHPVTSCCPVPLLPRRRSWRCPTRGSA